MSMSTKRICSDFIENPHRDPLDGHRLMPGKGPYRGFVALCAENNYEVDYMLEDDFIKSLSSNKTRSTSQTRSPARSTSPVRSTSQARSTSPTRSPARSTSTTRSTSPTRSPLRPTSKNVIPGSAMDDRSVPRLVKSRNVIVPEVTYPETTSAVVSSVPQVITADVTYPRVVGPSVRTNAPVPTLTVRSERIGNETFNPDPIMSVMETPERTVRETVRGPYGKGGNIAPISGTHKYPGQRTYTTSNIPEHEVRSMGNNIRPMNGPPIPFLISRTEQIGTETFNPDPMTHVKEVQARSYQETVRGPYGNNGENVLVSGVHKVPGQRVYTTKNIPAHEVNSINGTVNPTRGVPIPSRVKSIEQVGLETFDPDPISSIRAEPRKSIRTTVNGPYGPGGSNSPTTGIYTSPGRRIYTTMDIPEHEVRSSY